MLAVREAHLKREQGELYAELKSRENAARRREAKDAANEEQLASTRRDLDSSHRRIQELELEIASEAAAGGPPANAPVPPGIQKILACEKASREKRRRRRRRRSRDVC